MEIKHKIKYLEEAVQKDIPSLPLKVKTLIKKAIEELLMVDPVIFGKPLRYSLKGHRRLRIIEYRIIYRYRTKNSNSLYNCYKTQERHL